MRLFLACLFLLLLPLAPRARAQAARDVFSGHVVAVTAGDTLDVKVGGGWTVTVRLHGIECPDKPRALRETVTRYTARLTLDTDVRVEVRGTATRSVVYGEVYPAGGQDSVNVRLARVGLARWASVYAPDRTDIRAAADGAQRERRGIWGANDGANIVLPPSASEAQKARAEAQKAQATPTPRAIATPAPRVVTSPHPAPKPNKRDKTNKPHPPTHRPTVPTASPSAPLFLPAPFVGALVGFAAALALLFVYALVRALPPTPPRFVALALVAICFGGVGALLAALPTPALSSLLSSPSRGVAGIALPAACLLPATGLLLLRAGIRRLRDASRLRGAAVDPRAAAPGFVKLNGTARSVAGELAASDVGNLPGLFVRETTARYTAETTHGKRLPAPRWQTLRDTMLAVDFELFSTAGDGTGSAVVLAAQDDDVLRATVPARWLPYHVARFYNEIPAAVWQAKPYEGDTRTEVYFVPDGATLTVWGEIAPPTAANQPPQIGGMRLLIVDGAEERAYRAAGVPSVAVCAAVLLLAVLCAAGGVVAATRAGNVGFGATLASLGAAAGIALLLHLKGAAALARGGDRAAWDEYRRGFPGALLAPAVSD